MNEILQLSAAERAYKVIRERIISLDLKPNQAVRELTLAKELKVSRTPIREALTRLSGEGFIDFYARAGTVVSPIRMEAVRTAQYVREKLELSIIGEAVERRSDRAIFQLGQLIEEQRFAVSKGDLAMFFSSDEKMHLQFSEMAGRAPVWSLISESKRHMDRVRRLSLEGIDLSLLLNDHEKLLAAIVDNDQKTAWKVMTSHLRRVMEDIEIIAARNGDYFELEGMAELPPQSNLNGLQHGS